jgi:hypothetical protein
LWSPPDALVIAGWVDRRGAPVHRPAMSEEKTMLARVGLDAQEALVCTMLLVAATDGITDREIGAMSAIVQTLPAFTNFSTERLDAATDAAVNLLREDNGLPHAAQMIRDALEPRLRETAYACACEVVAATVDTDQDTLRMLQFVRDELHLDPLVAAAIERGVRARNQKV